MDKDNLWTRRSNSSKLFLSTQSSGPTNGSNSQSEPQHSRGYTNSKRYGGDTSSHGKPNPFNALSPAPAMPSPTSGASGAFALGTGAFASFGGSVKDKKSSSNSMDYTGVVGGAKPAGTEKGSKEPVQAKVLRSKSSGSALGVSTIATTKTSASGENLVPAPVQTLKNGWVFWFRPPISKSNGFLDYEKTLHPMAGFDNVADFFAVYRHLKRPSSLPLVSDYHLFKKGIRPVWEDYENRRGGKWIVRLKKNIADRYWEDLVFAMIGDQFGDASDEVCGAVLSVRNGEDILSVWTRNEGQRVLKIRETMKRILAFPLDTKVEWKSHDSSIQQRTAIDDARKDKNVMHHSEKRNGSKEDNISERKMTS